MKLRIALITTAIVCSTVAVEAQRDSSQNSSRKDSTQVEQSTTTGNEIISSPAGSDRPRGRAFNRTNPPPGRAFSTNNPPQGRPFESGNRPPGRPFTEGEEAGIPTDDPAGAERAKPLDDSTQQPTDDATGLENKDQDQSTQPDTSSGVQIGSPTPDNSVNEPAGAQRGNADQLAKALVNMKTGVSVEQNTELKQAIQASIQGKNVPNEFIDRLSRDLSTSFATVQLKQDVQVQFAEALNTVLTAQPGNQVGIEQALSTVQTLLIQNGVTRPSARAVACDLHLIATEVAPGLQLSVPVPR